MLIDIEKVKALTGQESPIQELIGIVLMAEDAKPILNALGEINPEIKKAVAVRTLSGCEDLLELDIFS